MQPVRVVHLAGLFEVIKSGGGIINLKFERALFACAIVAGLAGVSTTLPKPSPPQPGDGASPT
jgi:hypothetical protein